MSWGEQICHLAEVGYVCRAEAAAAGCSHSLGLNVSWAANQSDWQVPASPAHLKDSHNSAQGEKFLRLKESQRRYWL